LALCCPEGKDYGSYQEVEFSMTETVTTKPHVCINCKESIQEGAEICIFCGEFLGKPAKECKFCARKISKAAKKCIHCGEDQEKNWLGFKDKTLWDLLSLLLVPLILGSLAIWLPSNQANKQEDANAYKTYLD
jgi:RNA polymerase subunit RPABC4/transcription elongation factor Spt4